MHQMASEQVQHQLQRSRAFAGQRRREQQAPCLQPPSPHARRPSPRGEPICTPVPGYQVSQLMNRSPVAGQNVNITLQNVGPVVGGNPQITLVLAAVYPTSPGFQFSAQQRRLEHGSPSYIQVTSPLSQQVQTQSPTQPSLCQGRACRACGQVPRPGLGPAAPPALWMPACW